MDESVTVAGAESRKGLVALILLLAILAAVVAVPLALGGSEDELRPLGLVPGGSRDETAGAAADAMYPYQQITYQLEGDLPDLGDEGPVWQLVRPPMDAARAGQLAAALGASGEVTEHDGGYSVTGDDAAAEIFPSGGAWMVSVFGSYDAGVREDVEARPGVEPGSDGSSEPPTVDCVETTDPDGMATKECTVDGAGTPLPPDVVYEEPPMEGPEDLPSEDEALDIALDLLRGAGVLPADYETDVSDGAAMGVGVACPVGVECAEASTEMVVLSRNVTVTTTLGGQRVEGLSWSVEVGDLGDVQGVWGVYAETEEVGDYPLRPIDEAYAAMVAGELPYDGGPMPLGGVSMEDLGRPEVMVGDVVGGDASVGSAELTVETSSPCPDSPIADCAVASDPVPMPEPICSDEGCSTPGGPADGGVMCVTDPCPGGDDPVPPPGCVVQPDGRELCETPIDPDDHVQCGVAPCVQPGCVVQPDGTELCEAPVPGEPPVCIDDPGLTPEPLPAPEPLPGEEVPVAPQTDVGGGTDGSGGGGHGEEILIAPVDPCDVTEPPMPVDPPVGCKVQPDGSEICEPIEEPPFEPEPMVVTVTGATLGAMVVPALAEDGSETAYVVPTYLFDGTWANGEAWSQPVVAVSDEWLGSPATTTVPPEPTTTVDPGPTTTIDDPDCVGPDGEDRCVEPSIPTTSVVEPPVTIEPIPPCVVQPDGSEICEIPSTTVPTTIDPGLTPEPVPAEIG